MWSIGVIAYQMITGYLPFFHEFSENEIAQKIIHNEVKYPIEMSENAIDFIMSMSVIILDLLQKSSKNRMNIEEALIHPWIFRNSI